MKKKYRDITIDGVEYAWMVSRTSSKEKTVKVWLNKKVFINTTLRVTTVTPKDVAELIREQVEYNKLLSNDGKLY